MTTDADITYRWLTQADLDAMLDEAFERGAEAMQMAVVKSMFCGDFKCADCDPEEANYVRRLPLPKRPA